MGKKFLKIDKKGLESNLKAMGIDPKKYYEPETKDEGWENRIREDFQKFADSIVWQNDVGDEKYIGVGNMADWWIKKIGEVESTVYERVNGEIAREVEKMIDENDDGMWAGREIADKILSLLNKK
jgi:hypothetical protein